MTARVVTHRLRLPGWPEGRPLRIVILSDLHAARPWMPLGRIARIVDQAQALGGDLIALLGDYPGHLLFSPEVPPAQVTAELARLRAPLGVWSVFGNHDWRDDPEAMHAGRAETHWHRLFAEHGIACLENRNTAISHRGQPVVLAGIASQRAFRRARRVPRNGAHDLEAALAGLDGRVPVILLAHEPDIFPALPDHVSLTLCGHTHGGQIRPFGRAWVVPSGFGTRYAYGHIEEGARQLVVSGGLGCSGIPLRWRMPPEITVVEIA